MEQLVSGLQKMREYTADSFQQVVKNTSVHGLVNIMLLQNEVMNDTKPINGNLQHHLPFKQFAQNIFFLMNDYIFQYET
jgi:hypothetical protein